MKKDELEKHYQNITSLYDMAEELASTVESKFIMYSALAWRDLTSDNKSVAFILEYILFWLRKYFCVLFYGRDL